MNQRKAQHVIWDRFLTKYLLLITWCEICKIRPAIEKAHRVKRRFIGWRTEEDKLEYFCAAKLCRVCHKSLDEAIGEDVHQKMFEKITSIVLRRRPFMLNGPKLEPPFIEWDPVRIYNYAR